MSQFEQTAIEALADAWASIDGKVDAFRAGKGAKSIEGEPGGRYSGYMAEAEEMLKRLLKRGFILSPAGSWPLSYQEGLGQSTPTNG
jgi:hypothetical protein